MNASQPEVLPSLPCSTVDPRTVLVAGGGVSGLRAAEQLRAHGFTGTVRIVGTEDLPAYSRPPLSKKYLIGAATEESLALRRTIPAAELKISCGQTVVDSDLDLGIATLAGGEVVKFDGLVIATGLRPRRLSTLGPDEWRLPLRSVMDAQSLRPFLVQGCRVVVLGSGVLGCEVASAATSLGCQVSVIGIEDSPMERSVGATVGQHIRRAHELQGVRWRLGTTATQVRSDLTGGRIVEIESGEKLCCDIVVEAVGGIPNTDWLRTDQFDLDDGVMTDSWLRPVRQGKALELVVAAGDVARFPLHGLVGRFEHWDMAVHTARRAGATLAAQLLGAELPTDNFAPLPTSWSDQAGIRISVFGLAGGDLKAQPLTGVPGAASAVGFYRFGHLVGAAVVGPPATANTVRKLVAARLAVSRT